MTSKLLTPKENSPRKNEGKEIVGPTKIWFTNNMNDEPKPNISKEDV